MSGPTAANDPQSSGSSLSPYTAPFDATSSNQRDLRDERPNSITEGTGALHHAPEQQTLMRSASGESYVQSGPLVEGAESHTSHDQQALAPSFDELLFDLLFAASLNTYSHSAKLYNGPQVLGFIGYFALLWWAWWTQSVFDTRFRRPELGYGRVFRTMQILIRLTLLGAWVGLSSTPAEFSRSSFTNFSTVYAGTRLLLVIDLLAVVVYNFVVSWRESKTASTSAALRWHPGRTLLANWGPLFSALGSLISAALWFCVRYQNDRHSVNATLLSLWLVGVSVELITQIITEAFWATNPLGLTVLPERLSLLGLIILGEGFNGVSEQLTRLSPGYRTESGLDAGGWSGLTILQVVSATALIVVLFWGYFRRAAKEYHSTKLLALLSGYLHLIIHAASAVVIISAKRLITFVNTLVALSRFLDHPERYLPQTPEWSIYTPEYIANYYNETTDVPSAFTVNLTDPGMASILAVVNVIQSTDGSQIPSVEAARWLAHTAASFILNSPNGTEITEISRMLDNSTDNDAAEHYAKEIYGTALATQLESQVSLSETMVNSFSTYNYISNQLFQYRYLFAACALYLAADCGIKIIQASGVRRHDGRSGLKERKFWISMGIRFLFAVALICTQIAYFEKISSETTSASDVIVLGGLTICVGIQLLELIAQVALDSSASLAAAWRFVFCRRQRERKRHIVSTSASQDTDLTSQHEIELDNLDGDKDPEFGSTSLTEQQSATLQALPSQLRRRGSRDPGA